MPKDNPAGRPTPRSSTYFAAARQVVLGVRRDNPFVQLALFTLFMAALVGIMTAGFDVRDDALTPDSVGTQSRRDVDATREFAFTERNTQLTARQRASISASTPPVYDWDEGASTRRSDAIHSAFEATRSALATTLRENNVVAAFAPASVDDQGAVVGPPAPLTDVQIIASATPAQREAYAKELRTTHFEPAFPGTLSETDYDTLARDGFSARTEANLTDLVVHSMGRMIVPQMRALDAQRATGIYLRRVRDSEVLVEYRLTNLSESLVDLDAAPLLVRARARAIGPEPSLEDTLVSAAVAAVSPNTRLNPSETQLKRDEAARAISENTSTETFYVGQPIVRAGEIITDRHVRIYDTMKRAGPGFSQTQYMIGLTLFALLALVVIARFARDHLHNLSLEQRDVDFLATTLLISAVLIRSGWALATIVSEQLGLAPAVAMGIVPVAASAMLVRLMLRSEHAIAFSLVLSVLAGLIWDQSLVFSSLTLLSCLVGAAMVGRVKHRMALMQAGLAAGLVSSGALASWLLLRGELLEWISILYVSLALGGGLLAGFFVLGTLPLFEYVFKYTTDIKLLELADLDHPLLRELIVKAPGSYHHSMMVGSLCEAAAEAIGCNALLARVGAYYHDIGKTKNPTYFAENQRRGDNPHDRIKPRMSALIIRKHVSDGVKMARAAGLPREIVDFVEQHHGTKLIAYFYNKAKEQLDPGLETLDEFDFRYPGPKPQSRETAICLLADGIEAASRSLDDPSPDNLKQLVQNMINHAFTEGQLDDCDLTLKDLNDIADAFMRILKGIYHHRPKYPGDKKKGNKPPKPQKPKERPNSNDAPKAPAKDETHKERPGSRPVTPMLGTAALTRTDGSADPSNETRDEHANRGEQSGERDDAPEARDTDSNDPKQGRASLPRLGSS